MMSTRSSRKRKRSIEDAEKMPRQEGEDTEHELRQEKVLSSAWEAFREEYSESVEQLPLALYRNFTLLAQLDVQGTTHLSRMPPAIRSYLEERNHICRTQLTATTDRASGDYKPVREGDEAETFSGDSNCDQSTPFEFCPATKLMDLTSLLNNLLRTSEEKVNLAKATYDSVDRHVRLLDQAIREHEVCLDRAPPTITAPTSLRAELGTKKHHQARQTAAMQQRPRALDIEEAPRSTRTRKPPAGSMISRPGANGALQALRPDLESTDMPIDPHEPTYCLCNQVSYGDMVACDGDDCRGEWFHLACVGLDEVPKQDKWFCKTCAEKNKTRTIVSRKRKH